MIYNTWSYYTNFCDLFLKGGTVQTAKVAGQGQRVQVMSGGQPRLVTPGQGGIVVTQLAAPGAKTGKCKRVRGHLLNVSSNLLLGVDT